MSGTEQDDRLITPERLNRIKELWEAEADPEFLRRDDVDLLIEVAELFLRCTGTDK